MKKIEDYKFTEDINIKREAIFDNQYRYVLRRKWDDKLPKLMWILLNPSIADDEKDDPTVKKCMGFAKGLGYGSIDVLNLFSYIATNPEDLKNIIDKKGLPYAIGKDNDKYIQKLANDSEIIIVGWGNNVKGFTRDEDVLNILKDRDVRALKINKSGYPKHPLYAKYLNIKTIDDLIKYEKYK